MQYDVVVLTEDRYENPVKKTWYNLQVQLEDELLCEALRQQGLRVERFSWSNPSIDWNQVSSVVFRTTWDYFHRIDEFKAWLKNLKAKKFNSEQTLWWNLDKKYLLDLKNKGVHVVDTQVHQAKSIEEANKFLTQCFDFAKNNEWIIKPVISGAARHTYRINKSNLTELVPILSALLVQEEFLIQPFQKNVCEQGEISLMVMGGQFTHAVLKTAKAGDFRVQDDHGGKVQHYAPSQDEIDFAEQAIAACDPKPIYARVDVVRDNQNQLSIMELELIEPELFFRFNPESASILARAIKQQL